MTSSLTILALNGSLRGAAGNTAQLIAAAQRHLPDHVHLDHLPLADYQGTTAQLHARLDAAAALLVATGVYWNSWGSPLQRCIEVMSAWEATPTFVGKPAAALLTMDSVGGADVAARLLAVLGLFGCTTAPFPSLVLSRTGAALRHTPGNEDVWQLEDVGVLVHNLCAAARAPRPAWRAWPVAHTQVVSGLYPHGGRLELGTPMWLRAPGAGDSAG